MTTRTERIEMRADETSEQLIRRAAAMLHESVSSFVLSAARARAERVLARAEVTLMPAEQFDALIASLDVPDPAPTLARAAARTRRFVRE